MVRSDLADSSLCECDLICCCIYQHFSFTMFLKALFTALVSSSILVLRNRTCPKFTSVCVHLYETSFLILMFC